MNFTLSTILILFFLLPGFLFRGAFYGKQTTDISFSSIFSSIVFIVISSCIIHICGNFFVSVLSPYQIDKKLIIEIFSGHYHSSQKEKISEFFREEIQYLFLILFMSYVFGTGARWVCINALSFYKPFNPWFYYLEGYTEKAREGTKIRIAATLSMGEHHFLYYGYLEDYTLTKTGELDSIILYETYRRPITKDKANNGKEAFNETLRRFYPIDGSYFILKYKDITSLNIEYTDSPLESPDAEGG